MRKVIANKRCKGVVLQPLSIDFPGMFFCGCECLPNLRPLGEGRCFGETWPGEMTVIPILQESRKDLLGWRHLTSGGFYLLNLLSLGELVLLPGMSKQHHYQASAPQGTHRKTLDSSTSIQHGDGRRKQHSHQHGQDHHQPSTGWASSHKDPSPL